MLAQDLERIAVDDLVVPTVRALTAGEGRIDDDLVPDVEAADPVTDCIDRACAIGAADVGEMLGGGKALGDPEIEVIQRRMADLIRISSGPGSGSSTSFSW